MKYTKRKTFQVIIIIITFLTIASPANASGFIYKWESFVIDNDLFLDNSGEKVIVNDLSVLGLEVPISEDDMNMSALSAGQDYSSTHKSDRKSVWEKIKINISTSDRPKTSTPEIYSNGDGEQISSFINSITSLIYDDSKIKSLENIGTIIEPQINFYFEF